MPKAAAPTSKNRKSSKAMAFTTTTIVSFSLTLLGASVAVLSGLVPLHLSHGARVDVGALLFLTPMIALMLAVCSEVVRIALRSPELPQPRRQRVVRWSPGRREM